MREATDNEMCKKKDAEGLERLKRIAVQDAEDPNNYYNTLLRKTERVNRVLDPMFEILSFVNDFVTA